MTKLELRDYQREDLEAVEAAHRDGVRRPVVVWATGLGKTVLFGEFAARFRRRTGRRVVALAHRTELVDQAAAEIAGAAPDLSVGVVMGQRNQTLRDIVTASPQTLAGENRRRQLLNVGAVIVDECHHYAAPSYRAVLDWFQETYPDVVFLGVTATLSRGDRRSLGAVWDRVIARRTISFGIANGHLVRPYGKRVTVDDFDVSKVKMTAGDYDATALGAALASSMAPKKIAEALREHSPNDKAVVFCPDIRSADIIAEACRAEGFAAESVNYKVPPARRRAILQAHRDESPAGLQVVTNPMILTEGWNNPPCRTGVLARRTTHAGLYVQMAGRVLRPWFGKRSALLLDVAGATELHSLDVGIDLFGDEPGEVTEREPCMCATGQGGALGGLSLEALCSCRRQGCTPDCFCGGGKTCGCEWPAPLVVDDAPEPLYRDGKLQVVDVDLFHASKSQWLTTYGGTHFLSVGGEFIAILPGAAPGLWDVARVHEWAEQGFRWIQRGLADLGYAQAYAEADVTPDERRRSSRARGWRAMAPTQAQLQRLAPYGIVPEPGQHAGEISDQISTIEASIRLDPLTYKLREAQRYAVVH